jgi:hypothetical protein
LTIINFKVDEEKKKKIEEITELKGYKSVSDFIREAIDEKMNLQKLIDNFTKKNPPIDLKKIEIPDFIPDGKYLGISRNTIVIIEDTLQDALKKLYEKFPDAAAGVIRKGKKIEHFETLFSLFSAENTKCFQQAQIDERYYPILELFILTEEKKISFLGLIDTGASISALDGKFIENFHLKPIRNTQLLTANGIIEAPIYESKFQYEDQSYLLEFTSTNISGLPIKALIGKNFIDKFNFLFFGQKKLFCIQII